MTAKTEMTDKVFNCNYRLDKKGPSQLEASKSGLKPIEAVFKSVAYLEIRLSPANILFAAFMTAAHDL